MMTAIERYKQNLPERPYCSNSKQLSFIYSRDQAVSFPYIQVNNPYQVNYMVFDLDYEGSAMAYEKHNLPAFSLTAINKENGHSHAFYEIDRVDRLGSKTANKFLKDITWKYKELLCADKVITTQKQLTKNILSDKWQNRVLDRKYTLTELSEASPALFKHKISDYQALGKGNTTLNFESCLNPLSRNITLFEFGRRFAYRAISSLSGQDELYMALLSELLSLNKINIPKFFIRPLPHRELKDITKSIARWVWRKRDNFRQYNIGAMAMPTMRGRYWQPALWAAEVQNRQSAAALWVAGCKKAKRLKVLKNEIY